MSLDILKLYREDDMICQNPKDIDPDRWNPKDIDPDLWLDKGELTKLPEIPSEETEVRVREPSENQREPVLYPEPDLDIPILPEDSKVIAEREGIHERIQLEIQTEVSAEEMLEVPPAWNEVPDLLMAGKDGMLIKEADTKHKRDEVAWGRRKRLISSLRNMNILPQYLR